MWKIQAEYIDELLNLKHSAENNDSNQNLSNSIGDSNMNTLIPYYRPLHSHRRILGKPIVFMRRVIRRLLRFLVEPITEEQSVFNASATALLNEMNSNICNIRNELSSTKSELSSNKDALWNQINNIWNSLGNTGNELSSLTKHLDNEKASLGTLIHEMYSHLDHSEMHVIRALKDYVTSNTAANISTSVKQDKSDVHSSDIDAYSSMDYFNFENHFRGTRHNIKKMLAVYLPFFEGKSKVIDLGCGRGEFLELLKKNNIDCIGVDLYDEFIMYCRMKGLDVVCEDVNQYLRGLDDESVDGIFSAHLVEHLKIEELLALYKRSFEVLKPGGCIVIETPNPTCLGIYYNWFYADPSHVKPVHPKTQEYFLKESGFNSIEILYTDSSKLDYRLPLLHGENISNLNQFNDGMNHLSDILFGSMDYAVIAKK